jgi:E3 ubiquitin-protein ligase CCNP1IP1
VLAGLRPEIIMDICRNAITFYDYQVSQEVRIREMLQRKLEAKFNMLYQEYNNATHDLNRVLKGKVAK